MKGNDFEMNRKIKQILSLLLAAVIFVGVMPMSTVPASAATNGHSQSEAMAWLNSKIGIQIGNGQCPALAREYYSYLGYSVSGNGKDYENNVPNGWTRTYYYSGYVPQPGDIAVWRATNTDAGKIYGHVAIVQSATSGSMTCYEQGYTANYKVRTHGYSYGMVTCFIRPDFNSTPTGTNPPFDISISANTYSIGVGDTVTFNYSISGASNKSIGIDWAGGSRYKTIGLSNDSGTVSYTFTEPGLFCCITEGSNSNGYNCCNGIYIRVIDTVPKDISISSNITSVAVGDTVDFSYAISGATTKCIGIDWVGGSRYKTIGLTNDSGTASCTFTEPGLFCCITEGYNSIGYNCCDGVYVRVIDTAPTNCKISLGEDNKAIIPIGSTVTFDYSILGAKRKYLGIDYAGGDRYDTVSVDSDNGTTSYTFTKASTYCCIIEGFNNLGYNCSPGVYITVFDPNISINFDANGGYCSTTSKVVTYGKPYGDLPVPSRNGYKFDGWYTEQSSGEKITKGDTVNSEVEITLYAHWTANNYILSYNANGGTGSIENQTKIHGENLTLSSVKPTGKSFTVNYNANGGSVSASGKTVSQTFTNWNTAKNGSGKSYLPGATYSDNANLTLYAQYSNPSVGTLPTPTRSGYTFDGWYTAKDGGTKVSESLKVTANITLYAHWTKIEQHIPTVKSVKIDDNAEINYKSSYKISSEITAESGAEYTAEWQSSNPKVASVDKDGKVTALKKGTAKITCTVKDSYGNTVSDTCDVTVKYSFGQWLIKILLFGWIWY